MLQYRPRAIPPILNPAMHTLLSTYPSAPSVASPEFLVFLRAGLLRAHESVNETALWVRFVPLTTRDQRRIYVLDRADEAEEVAEICGLSPADFIGETCPCNRCRNLSFITEEGAVCLVDGMFEDADDCVWLDSEDEYALGADCVEVNVRHRNGRRGTEYRRNDDDSFFYCEWARDYYDDSSFTRVEVDGETVCLEQNEDDLYYWESDGEYHTNPEPEEGGALGLSGYHGGHRSPVVAGESFSIELEVNVGSPDEGFGDAIRTVADAAEEDGSLPDNGAEIIFGSCHISKITDKVARVCSVLKQYDCSGHVENNAGFGMHVNVSRKGWGIGQAALARILLFVSENQPFFEAIAQRKEIHWAKYFHKTVGRAVKAASGLGCEKYEAVACRSNDRLEFRLFRSSCRADRILKNVECVAAVIRYCKAVENHKNLSLAAFRAYLADNAKSYPNLTAFIAEKSV